MAEQCRPKGPITLGLNPLAIAAQPFCSLFFVCFNKSIGPCLPHVRQTHMLIMAASMTPVKSNRRSWDINSNSNLSTKWLAGLYWDL